MEFLQELYAWLSPHWPGVTWTFVAALIGQVMAHRVFTRKQAHTKRKGQWFWWWSRKTLPLHPVVAGGVLGLMWTDPEGAGWPWIGSVVYFAFFGAISIWLYEFVKGVLKKKTGIDVGALPGSSNYPPPMSDGDE